jgi:hypothetical protein
MRSIDVEQSGRRYVLNEVSQVGRLLHELKNEDDPNLDLINEQGDFLSISVRNGFALVRFTHASLDPPYFSASTGGQCSNEASFDFIVGDTPTPVPIDRRISLEVAIAIAEHFCETGEIPHFIEWKED